MTDAERMTSIERAAKNLEEFPKETMLGADHYTYGWSKGILQRDAQLKDVIEKLIEAGEGLKGVAESYAMQTYDRSGVIRKSIEEWEEAKKKAGV